MAHKVIRHRRMQHPATLCVLVQQADRELVLLPSLRIWVLSVQYVTNVLLELISYAHLQMKTEFAGVRRRPHGHSDSVVHFVLRLG